MGKKKLRSTYVSKGERRNVSRKTIKLCVTSALDKALNQHRAFTRGITDPWVTIKNPVKGTKREYIKVRYSEYNNLKAPKRSILA